MKAEKEKTHSSIYNYKCVYDLPSFLAYSSLAAFLRCLKWCPVALHFSFTSFSFLQVSRRFVLSEERNAARCREKKKTGNTRLGVAVAALHV
jgi:hypothetical protein